MNAPQQQLITMMRPAFDQIAQVDTPSVIQPDALGEFPTPLDGALFMAGFNIRRYRYAGRHRS